MAQASLLIRKPYGPRYRLPFDTGSVSRTKQSFQDESDINNILKKYLKTGVMEHVRENEGQYIDLPEVPDYQEALNIVIRGREAFDSLPGSVRERFQNNAEDFLGFMNDPANMEESVELGLRELPEVDEEPPVEPPTAEPPSAE